MTYNFDKSINRKNTDSLKWDVKENEIPMWVADMDFETAPQIICEMKKRVEHGVFGYSIVGDDWYRSYQNWWQKRHNLSIEKDWLIFCTGVVPALSSCVRKLTTPGENVLVQTPVYNIFFNSIRNNGRNVLESPLVLRDNEYQMDFNDLEEKLSDPQTSLMILCNPQNPSGKIWDKDSLEKVGNLCQKYNVKVISDEIHCDLTRPGYDYIPFASLSDVCRDISITCISASKAFNMAGMQSAAVMIPNKNIRHKVYRALNTDEVAEPNSLALVSTIAAFEKGGEWLDQLRKYLFESRDMVKDYLEKNIPQLHLVEGNATYLLWIDVREIYEKYLEKEMKMNLAQFIRNETGLYLSDGVEYGGEGFLRMNIACPKELTLQGLKRLEKGIKKI